MHESKDLPEHLAEFQHSLVKKTLETLASSIDARDPQTAAHGVRVSRYSSLIAEVMELSPDDREVLKYAALLHDYGKIGVPEVILWKQGELSPEEEECMQTHALLTYKLLSNVPYTPRLAQVPFIASCHHEWLDGSGYYRALKGDEIPLLARIITFANEFDNATKISFHPDTYERVRRPIVDVDRALQSVRGTYFDPLVMDAFDKLPSDSVIEIMESERGYSRRLDLAQFKLVSWRKLIDLIGAAKLTSSYAQLIDSFGKMYDQIA